ncbi:MAG TPA: NADH-quinone oxidoreductase subunit J, partial [Thermodesulfobacteriota bacterium]|nr:NADH-quinone oxidoreductase subunit J [Thermodesulfobacteriota bacterium]
GERPGEGRAAGTAAGAPSAGWGFGEPKAIGRLLFTDFLIPFEIASVLLLAAMVGAVVLAKRELRP